MTRRVAYALVVLFVLAVGLGVANLFWTSHEVNANQAAQAVQQAAQRAAQRRAGLLVEKALCADVGTMAAIRPPAGNAAANPSRAYEQAEHRAWLGLVAAIGCKESP